MTCSPCFRSRSLIPLGAIALLAILAGGLATPLAALHPNHPLGLDPERSYFSGAEGLDKIDLYSGTLSVTIPIGPFELHNNSNVWFYFTEENGDVGARPDFENTAGIGWSLGWGQVYHPNHFYNETEEWLYVDEAGGRHSLYDKLHRDDDDDGDVTGRIFYSRDGSYLRMRLSDNNCHAYIEHPDGTTRRFSGSCGPATTYTLNRVWSAYASEADPDVIVTYGLDPDDPHGTDTLRTVTDRYGLTHKIHLSDKINGDPKNPIHWVSSIVTKVDLESFGGQRAIYSFFYRQFHVQRSCKADAGGTILVPHLERIELPDGTNYTMREGNTFFYENECRSIDGEFVDDLPGVLTGINLPSGGRIRWDYQRYNFPFSSTNSVFDTGAGVKTRTLLSAPAPVSSPGPLGSAGAGEEELGVWSFKTTNVPFMTPEPPPEVPNHPEMHTEVVYPTGACTKHYFDAIYWLDPVNPSGNPWGWERGLNFVYTEESDGRYLSSQVYTGNDGNGSCSGTKLRSSYLRFRHDKTPGNTTEPISTWYNTNRGVEASRTVFHDDGNWYVDTELSDFDGLGHFRQRVQTSNFWGLQTRTTTIGYNRSSGTYPDTYMTLQISEPWILGVFDSATVNQPGADGVNTVKSEFSFEDTTGFLTCSRTLASGTTRSAADLLTVRTHNTRGQILDIKLYGGDLQPLAISGGQCGTVPALPVYWTSNEYDPFSGAATKTWPRHPNGTYGSFPTYDVTVEPRTGFMTKHRDPAGFETIFNFDEAGRPLAVTPQDGAGAIYTYFNASATSQARANITYQVPSGSPVALRESEVVADDFGRPRLERRNLPGGGWSEQETAYNAQGWVESISEWGDLEKKTQITDFDSSGRPLTIRPPDGAGHDLTRIYRGVRVIRENEKVALAGGEATVQKSFLYDGFGKLRRVWEDSDPEGGAVSTTYSYNARGQLTKVETGDVATGQQVRSFTYDGRGFLLTATHPEKGASGNGTVTYSQYDADGRFHAKVDGPNDLRFTYDFMGRPLTTLDHGRGDRPVKVLTWDNAPGLGTGKLFQAKRYNYIDLPWNAAGEETVIVQQSFAYNGLGGLPSLKKTELLWSSDDFEASQTYDYDDLGNLTQKSFPNCDAPEACAASPVGSSDIVTYTFDQGLLTSVPGWVNQINYHSSGLWQQIAHSNGVTENQEQDDHFTNRPKRLFGSGADVPWDSGVMLYDGAGNLKSLGADVFTYDRVNRVVETSYGAEFPYIQSFAYDRFGNITGATGDVASEFTAPAVNSATNRLAAATYDAAGNMLVAPPNLPSAPFRYDTDNLVVAQGYLLYLYDAFGERAVSLVNDEVEAAIYFLRDLQNQVVSDIHMSRTGKVASWSRHRDYVFAAGRLVGRSEPNHADRHYHLDRLGSVWKTTNDTGIVWTENEFWAYGEHFGPDSRSDNLLFAGPHERDFVLDTDYMHARQYWWKTGRFNSPDLLMGDVTRPQTQNRYVYATGNPINNVDPDGRESSAAVRFEKNAKAVLAGTMSRDEFREINRANALGAGVGLSLVGGGTAFVANRTLSTALTFTGAGSGLGSSVFSGDLLGAPLAALKGAYIGFVAGPFRAVLPANSPFTEGLVDAAVATVVSTMVVVGNRDRGPADKPTGDLAPELMPAPRLPPGRDPFCFQTGCFDSVSARELPGLAAELRAIDIHRTTAQLRCTIQPALCAGRPPSDFVIIGGELFPLGFQPPKR